MAHTPKRVSSVAPPPTFKPYVPASQSPAEFTAKAVVLGVLFGLLFGASTVYLGLRAGLTGCIGCGCLSLDRCELANPRDRAGRQGPGARYWISDPLRST